MNRLMYRLLSGRWGAAFEIRILLRKTAETFGVKTPKSIGFSVPEYLRNYAHFTADQSVRAIQSGQDLTRLRRELYRTAYRLGSCLRRWLKPQNKEECFAVLVLLYRNIGITIREEKPREICVDQCYFSAFYTSEVCCVTAAIDQGIFAGICQGGQLVFYERITEGRNICRADFR